MSLSPLFSSRYQWVAIALAVSVLGAVGFLPLFAGPSYEFALAAGVLLPSVAAATTALEVARQAPTPEEAFQRGLLCGFLLSGAALVIALMQGARVGFCGLREQLAFFLLGPGLGTIVGGAWGSVVGLLSGLRSTRKQRGALAVSLACLGPLASIAFSFWRYYQSPIIFAFDHFVGFFAGTLYDTLIDATPRLLTYRAASLGLLLTAFAWCRLLYRTSTSSLRLRWGGRPWSAIGGALGLVLFLALTIKGPELGHYQSERSIRAALGHVAESKRCRIVYASGILKRDAHALARECDAHIVAHEAFFEVAVSEKATVYLFTSAEQKAHYMGARNVNIAKPWRYEVYIQQRGYPHPVLGHELAHVVAGEFGTGPFRVAGPLGAWIPDPGRIEGVAVAAAPREDTDLTLMEWAKAMREVKLLPPLAGVFKLSFLGKNSSRAYTVAGAFVAFVHSEHGAAAVKAWYNGETVERATGKSLTELERDFHAALDGIEISSQAKKVAQARFERPAIFGRRCPHQVDKLNRAASVELSRLDPAAARETYRRVLVLDPHNTQARLGIARCELREGKLKLASAAYKELATDQRLTELWRAYALERDADVAVLAGDFQRAGVLYRQVQALLVDEHHLRTLDVKRLLTERGSELGRAAITALLLGDPVQGTDWAVSASKLGAWSQAEATNGLADYLLGRNFQSRGRWNEAALHLDRALARNIPLKRVQREALRSRLFVACALGQKHVAQRSYDRYLAQPAVSDARRAGVTRFAQRCELRVSTNHAGSE